MGCGPPAMVYATAERVREWNVKNSAFKITEDVVPARFIYELCWSMVQGELPVMKCRVALEAAGLAGALSTLHADEVASIMADTIAHMGNEISAPGEARLKLVELAKWLHSANLVPARLLQERCEEEFLWEAELVKMEPLEFKKKTVRVNTRLQYTQTKFNLLREESEGYAKLCTMLSQSGPEGLTYDTAPAVVEAIKSLIGHFDLDPNRVFDIVLDCYEMQPANGAFLRLIPLFPKSHAVHILGFKFQFYQRPEVAEGVPPSLYVLAATLVKAGFIDLDAILGHLTPFDDEAIDAYKQVLARRMDEVNRIGKINLAATGQALMTEEAPAGDVTVDLYAAVDSEDVAVEARAGELSANHKLGLLLGFLAADDWPHAHELLRRLSGLNPVSHPPICSALFRALEQAIAPAYRAARPAYLSKRPARAANPLLSSADPNSDTAGQPDSSPPSHLDASGAGTSNSPHPTATGQERAATAAEGGAAQGGTGRDGDVEMEEAEQEEGGVGEGERAAAREEQEEEDAARQAVVLGGSGGGETRAEVPPEVYEMLRIIGPYLSRDVLLLQKVCRTLRANLQATSPGPALREARDRVAEVCQVALLPSLQLVVANPPVCLEIWELLSCIPYETRYRLYGEWERDNEALPMLIAARQTAKLDTRRILKRLAKENLKQLGRMLAKLAHSNPMTVLRTIVNQLESYKDMIAPVVDAFKYFNQLEFDILEYVVIERLAAPHRGKVKEDGLNTADWLQCLASFWGTLCKKYPSMELRGLFQYLNDQLKRGEGTELILLQELVQQMASVEHVENLTEDQLDAMAGGEVLRQLAATFVQVRNNKALQRSMGRLKDALVGREEPALAVPLLVLIAQHRINIVMETEARHVKLVGEQLDRCHGILLQYVEFLCTAVAPVTAYARLIPPLHDLVNTFHIEPEIAFLIYRPIMRLFRPHRGALLTWPSDTSPEAERLLLAANQKAQQLAASAAGRAATTGEVKAAGASGAAATATAVNGLEAEGSEVATEGADNGELVLDLGSREELGSATTWTDLLGAARAMLPPKAWTGISPALYLTFWGLALGDLYVPRRRYEAELAKQKAAMHALETSLDNSSQGIQKRKKEKERIQELLDKLAGELARQEAQLAATNARLAREKDSWLSSCTDYWQTMAQFLHHCVLPRVMMSTQDAIFCARFIQRLHELATPHFSTIMGTDTLMCRMLPALICSSTEAEAGRLGRFLFEMLKMIYHWKGDEGIYERECANKPGCATGFKKGSEGMTFDMFRKINWKWNAKLLKNLSAALDSTEYMEIRNALTILAKVAPVFPATKKGGVVIERRVVKIKSDERQDLKLMATSVAAALSSRKHAWVTDEEFGGAPPQVVKTPPPPKSSPGGAATAGKAGTAGAQPRAGPGGAGGAGKLAASGGAAATAAAARAPAGPTGATQAARGPGGGTAAARQANGAQQQGGVGVGADAAGVAAKNGALPPGKSSSSSLPEALSGTGSVPPGAAAASLKVQDAEAATPGKPSGPLATSLNPGAPPFTPTGLTPGGGTAGKAVGSGSGGLSTDKKPVVSVAGHAGPRTGGNSPGDAKDLRKLGVDEVRGLAAGADVKPSVSSADGPAGGSRRQPGGTLRKQEEDPKVVKQEAEGGAVSRSQRGGLGVKEEGPSPPSGMKRERESMRRSTPPARANEGAGRGGAAPSGRTGGGAAAGPSVNGSAPDGIPGGKGGERERGPRDSKFSDNPGRGAGEGRHPARRAGDSLPRETEDVPGVAALRTRALDSRELPPLERERDGRRGDFDGDSRGILPPRSRHPSRSPYRDDAYGSSPRGGGGDDEDYLKERVTKRGANVETGVSDRASKRPRKGETAEGLPRTGGELRADARGSYERLGELRARTPTTGPGERFDRPADRERLERGDRERERGEIKFDDRGPAPPERGAERLRERRGERLERGEVFEKLDRVERSERASEREFGRGGFDKKERGGVDREGPEPPFVVERGGDRGVFDRVSERMGDRHTRGDVQQGRERSVEKNALSDKSAERKERFGPRGGGEIRPEGRSSKYSQSGEPHVAAEERFPSVGPAQLLPPPPPLGPPGALLSGGRGAGGRGAGVSRRGSVDEDSERGGGGRGMALQAGRKSPRESAGDGEKGGAVAKRRGGGGGEGGGVVSGGGGGGEEAVKRRRGSIDEEAPRERGLSKREEREGAGAPPAAKQPQPQQPAAAESKRERTAGEDGRAHARATGSTMPTRPSRAAAEGHGHGERSPPPPPAPGGAGKPDSRAVARPGPGPGSMSGHGGGGGVSFGGAAAAAAGGTAAGAGVGSGGRRGAGLEVRESEGKGEAGAGGSGGGGGGGGDDAGLLRERLLKQGGGARESRRDRDRGGSDAGGIAAAGGGGAGKADVRSSARGGSPPPGPLPPGGTVVGGRAAASAAGAEAGTAAAAARSRAEKFLPLLPLAAAPATAAAQEEAEGPPKRRKIKRDNSLSLPVKLSPPAAPPRGDGGISSVPLEGAGLLPAGPLLLPNPPGPAAGSVLGPNSPKLSQDPREKRKVEPGRGPRRSSADDLSEPLLPGKVAPADRMHGKAGRVGIRGGEGGFDGREMGDRGDGRSQRGSKKSHHRHSVA